MTTPSFTELGQSIRNVLNSSYEYGRRVVRITLKAKSENNLEIDSSYKLNCENPPARGDATVKLRLQDYGVLSEKWNSDGTINLEYKIDEGKIFEGLRIVGGYSYNPSTNDSGLKVTTKFKNDFLNCSLCVGNALDKHLSFLAGVVIGLRGLFIGYQFEYESLSSSFTASNIGVTYKFTDLSVYFKCSPGMTDHYDLSAVYKVNENFKAAITGTLTGLDTRANWKGGWGVQYKFDEAATLRMKFNNELQLDTSIQHLLYDGIKVTLAFGIDCRDFENSRHRVGLAIDMEV
ncbi:voltage-dependent anion-selective channel protein 1-like [Diachasmimorpha longicaudata]|uniref:voltage-dependent anion-selective channel protein 1-like n=1 Tax=Diachasmimorpha longicaudata TaxID=58733 RepID=UPI0030B8B11C